MDWSFIELILLLQIKFFSYNHPVYSLFHLNKLINTLFCLSNLNNKSDSIFCFYFSVTKKLGGKTWYQFDHPFISDTISFLLRQFFFFLKFIPDYFSSCSRKKTWSAKWLLTATLREIAFTRYNSGKKKRDKIIVCGNKKRLLHRMDFNPGLEI